MRQRLFDFQIQQESGIPERHAVAGELAILLDGEVLEEFGVVLVWVLLALEDEGFADLGEHVDEEAEFLVGPGFRGVVEAGPHVVDVGSGLAGAREPGSDLTRGFAEGGVGPFEEFAPLGVLTLFEGRGGAT